MDRQILNSWTLPDADPVKALAPIRRLVLGAFAGALLAGLVLIYSTLHVMWTTDERSMQDERIRAAAIADILADVPDEDVQETLDRLGMVAGLRELRLARSATEQSYQQSIPLLAGSLGGQFLTWEADRPGYDLFTSFAPLRVPLMLVLIGSVLGCLLIMQRRVRDIEAQRIAAQRQARRDHLTGLPNRLALEGELARLAGDSQPFSLLALDLDRFKPINDLFGHHAGDLALIEVARRLATQLLPGEFLARIGGDEFVAIVQRGGEREVLAELARDCIWAVSQPFHALGQNISVGVSLGIVEEGLDHPANALLKQADRALYEAKRLEGGGFCFTGETIARAARERSEEPRVPARLAVG
ncbi:GGDEF domain-containing protein [Devosia salina]|uniref:GGDEF domain-containing protein n=1 Tax=Devosia salina TaxID=2860336 RepID=A0ABX8WK62_9HYPH|nr:GGDEF domain-containing protein [Devosia salina]QYO77077.1 GGDEF domain-containing protein [Devosia salina]